MKKLCVISMLILGIVGSAFCQKTKAKYDTMTVLEGVRPPIIVNDFARKSDIYFNEEVKKNLNNLVIDFGNKNRLLINYQGVGKFDLKHNIDSLLRNFWQDYLLIRDTLRQNMVKKITYYGKNKNVNRKSMIDIQYFPQKEVFQFGKDVELVRLQQDTLVLVNFDDKATAELVKSANRVFKTYQNQSFLFNLNAIDDVEDVLENNINQAIIEASERVENERKTVKPWKILGIENDLASQRIRSKVKGNALFDFINFHADVGVGLINLKLVSSFTLAFEFTSSAIFKKGILVGIQATTKNNETIGVEDYSRQGVFFSGITFYKKNKLKSGIFVGFSSNAVYDRTVKYPNLPNIIESSKNVKLFTWHQLTPLIRLQIDMFDMEFKKIYPTTANPYNTKKIEIRTFVSNPNLRISFGF